MPQPPALSFRHSLILLRVTAALMFMAHAAVRLAQGLASGPGWWNGAGGFSSFLAGKGLPFAPALVLAITAFELIGGALLIAGFATRWLAAGFFGLTTMGIVLIHARLGWFVGEHGTGGMEYSVVLCVVLLIVAAARD